MPISRERVAVNPEVVPYGVHLTGADRATLLVTGRTGALWHLDARELTVLSGGRQLDDQANGRPAIRPADGAVLVSGRSAVTLLDAGVEVVWSMRHLPWDDFGTTASGAAWFDAEGRPFALVPSPGDLCEVVQLDESTGTVLRLAPVATAPAGLEAIHHPGGWVGLSVGEGQDGSYAWWVRLGDEGLEVLEAPWDDEVLFDVDPAGERILTTPHDGGPIRIRSFPALDLLRELPPPPGHAWDYHGCFAGDHVVARAHAEAGDEEILVAVDGNGAHSFLARNARPIVPGPDGSWFSSGPDGLERWRLA